MSKEIRENAMVFINQLLADLHGRERKLLSKLDRMSDLEFQEFMKDKDNRDLTQDILDSLL